MTGYRNGFGKSRWLTMRSGTVILQRPRVRGLDEKFESQLLPLVVKRTSQVSDLMPELYLHGLAAGDFELAWRGLLGEKAALSASAVVLLHHHAGIRELWWWLTTIVVVATMELHLLASSFVPARSERRYLLPSKALRRINLPVACFAIRIQPLLEQVAKQTKQRFFGGNTPVSDRC